MMKTPNTAPSKTSLGQDLRHALRYYLGGRRGVIVLAAVVLAAGAALNWSWLVAAGIAPVLLALLPCAAMCALGLCMNKLSGQSCSTGKTSKPDSAATGIAANAEQSEPNSLDRKVCAESSTVARAAAETHPIQTGKSSGEQS